MMLACSFFLVAGCATSGQAGTGHQAGAAVGAGKTVKATRTGARMLAVRDGLSACEQRLERGPRTGPRLAIAGASYTAGVGPGVPSRSWAAVLAGTLRWDSVIYGVPGAGYVAAGPSGRGPVGRMLDAEGLHALDPSLVIVQAGHDDGGVPPLMEARQVTRAVDEIRAQAPDAQIALLTTFTRPLTGQWRLYDRTDDAIVTAARAADPDAIIMDPLTGRWKFAHFDGSGLHPTAAGDAEIARKVGAILQAHGIVADSSATAIPLICQVSIGAGDRGTPRDA
jgi:lysophospholipase L1-like esterase